MKKILLTVLFVLLAVVPAQAGVLDLSAANASGGPLNGAFFSRTDLLGQGTGNFQPFVEIQARGTEEGYNTDYRYPSNPFVQFDETTNAQWNFAIPLSAIPLVSVTGQSGLYREILLNAAEPGQSNDSLSLDVMEIYLANTNTLYDYPTNWPAFSYNLGSDNVGANSILLDNITGQGVADMYAYIPDAAFKDNTGAYTGSYFYVYSAFSQSAGSAEKWGTRGASPAVPEPASMMLLGSGLLGILGLRRKV